jgi:hypothetical protein
MAKTQRGAAEIEALVREAWSDVFMMELREQLLLGALVNRDYSGEIAQKGDTVKVSQINAPNGELKTVGVDADSFSSEALSATQIEIKADKRAVASYDMEDLVMLQTQLGSKDSEIRASLEFAVAKQINDYLYSLVAPSAAAPDHTITGVTDFTSSQLGAVRTLASQAKWMRNKPWYLLMDPQYYGDLLSETNIISRDFVNDAPQIGGQIAERRLGFNILEDNSRAADFALAFHPDFLHLVMQTQPQFKVSDKHSSKEFGFVMSVDIVFGAKLGIDGDKKHITVTA